MKDGKPVFGSRTTLAAQPMSLFDSREPGEQAAPACQVAAPPVPTGVTASGSAIDARRNEETREEEEGAEVACRSRLTCGVLTAKGGMRTCATDRDNSCHNSCQYPMVVSLFMA